MESNEEQLLKEGDACPLCGSPLVLRHSERGDFLGCSNFPVCTYMKPVAVAHTVSVILNLDANCPLCHSPLQVKKGRYGIFIGCSNYPECNYVASHEEDDAVTCPICRKGLIKRRTGRSGRIFYACSRYPACDYSIPGKPVSESCDKCGFPLQFEKKTSKGIKLCCGNPLCSSRRRKKAPAKTVLP